MRKDFPNLEEPEKHPKKSPTVQVEIFCRFVQEIASKLKLRLHHVKERCSE